MHYDAGQVQSGVHGTHGISFTTRRGHVTGALACPYAMLYPTCRVILTPCAYRYAGISPRLWSFLSFFVLVPFRIRLEFSIPFRIVQYPNNDWQCFLMAVNHCIRWGSLSSTPVVPFNVPCGALPLVPILYPCGHYVNLYSYLFLWCNLHIGGHVFHIPTMYWLPLR